jgi:2-hydroxychromene-2-carboxylate isomerase
VTEPIRLDWYFDYVSPFSYLQHELFHRLPAGVEVRYRPLLFAALLDHWGHKGPAELPAKRVFTYRAVVWNAQRLGVPLRFPPAHPFNPLRALRLTVALKCEPAVVQSVFRFVWREGRSIEDPAEFERLSERLGVRDADVKVAVPWVKDELRANGEEALARGVFGVPTIAAGDDLFWGADATDMLLAWLADRGLFQRGEMARVSALPVGTQRQR